MRYLSRWSQLLLEYHSPQDARVILSRIEERFQTMSNMEPHTFHVPVNADILPLLALYETLCELQPRNQKDILDEVELLFKHVYARSLRRNIRLLRLLPRPFPLIRKALVQMCRNTYAPGDAEIIEDSPDRFAINGKRCLILEELTRRGAPELTRVFCKTDDWLAACLPAVRFTRTQTLATGGKVCDFRWEQMQAVQ